MAYVLSESDVLKLRTLMKRCDGQLLNVPAATNKPQRIYSPTVTWQNKSDSTCPRGGVIKIEWCEEFTDSNGWFLWGNKPDSTQSKLYAIARDNVEPDAYGQCHIDGHAIVRLPSEDARQQRWLGYTSGSWVGSVDGSSNIGLILSTETMLHFDNESDEDEYSYCPVLLCGKPSGVIGGTAAGSVSAGGTGTLNYPDYNDDFEVVTKTLEYYTISAIASGKKVLVAPIINRGGSLPPWACVEREC